MRLEKYNVELNEWVLFDTKKEGQKRDKNFILLCCEKGDAIQ